MIRRQGDPELKQAVQFGAEGQTKQALEVLEQRGRITAVPEATKRYEPIAQDYVRAHEAGQRTLFVSPAKDERRALNEKNRTVLLERGHIADDGREHMILVRHDLTRAQKNHARNYEPGDLLERQQALWRRERRVRTGREHRHES
jgi:hypothetical protein